MARKRKSKKIASKKDEKAYDDERSESQPPWPELPNDLLELILRHLPLPDYFRFASVCKSWFNVYCHGRSTTPPAPQLPWLLFCKPSPFCDANPRLHNITDGRSYRVPLRADAVSSHGWLIMQEDICSSDFFFLNPISNKKVSFPHHTEDLCRYYRIALSSSPADPDCIVALVWKDFSLFRLADPDHLISKWSDPYLFRDIVFFNEKFYALSWNYGLVSWDHSNSKMERVTLDYKRLHPELLFFPRRTYESLVSCKEGILLVSVFNLSNDHHEVCPPEIRIYVFRPDFDEKKWVKVQSLGGAVLFIGGRGQSFLVDSTMIYSDTVKGRGNRVYFARPYSWYEFGRSKHYRWCWIEYDLKDGLISWKEFPIGTGPTRVLWMTPSPT